MTTHKAIREALPELPAPDRTMWQYGQQIDHYTADQMRAYALQAVEAMRREPMTEEQAEELYLQVLKDYMEDRIDRLEIELIRKVEAHHHITQKEQG